MPLLFKNINDPAELVRERQAMVDHQIITRGVKDPHVLAAMKKVPRHLFVPPSELKFAYGDHPLPIEDRQTISQPYIIAAMTEALHLHNTDKVLEIGTGSGYQTAILAEITPHVYSIEYYPDLMEKARIHLHNLEYNTIHLRSGNGILGWPEEAPFNAIICTCSPTRIPPNWIEQLAEGGRMIIPLEQDHQQTLLLYRKTNGAMEHTPLFPVVFVPLIES